jgi:putative transposase
MARTARQDGAGAAHHVMVRGIERKKIFLDDEDRHDYLRRLDRLLPEEGWRCFAWALMPNHVHLVIHSSQGGLSRLMARLNTGYARAFNLRHDRVGYLFQNRFKSRLVEDETDLIGLVVYVLRNPLVGTVVDSPKALERYPWCSLGSLLGHTLERPFEAQNACLSLFADDRETARRQVTGWITASDSEPKREQSPLHSGPPIENDRTDGETPPGLSENRVSITPGTDAPRALDYLIRRFSEDLGIGKDVLLRTGRRGPTSDARALIAAIAVDELGLSRQQIGDVLNISATGVSKAAQRGRQIDRIRNLTRPNRTT